MVYKNYKCKCGCIDFKVLKKTRQAGLYCSRCDSWYKWASYEEIKSYNEECAKDSKDVNLITSYDIAKICSTVRGCKKCELGKHYDEICKPLIEQIKQARIPEDLYCIYLNQFKIGGKQ